MRRVVTVGAGELHPIASNDTTAGREQNRRVEVTIVPVKQPS
jgi:outer membrane protein OmpA-like peptidoglycan-associated protein